MKNYVIYSCIYLPYSFLRRKLITEQDLEIQNKESMGLSPWATKYLRHISLQFPILIRDNKCEMKIQIQRTLTSTEYEFLSDIKFSAGTNLNWFN